MYFSMSSLVFKGWHVIYGISWYWLSSCIGRLLIVWGVCRGVIWCVGRCCVCLYCVPPFVFVRTVMVCVLCCM